MKRLSVICAVLLAAVLLLVIPTLAANTVYFTAINNTSLELDDQSMPYMLNGTIYLPCSVFNSSDLGTYCLYSRNKQQVMISDLDNILYFDMSAGNCYDDRDTTYPYAAIYHNDTAYIPAFFTASIFGIQVSYIRNDYAPIIRLTKGNVLSDTDFLRGAAAIMETRLLQYNSSQSSHEGSSSETGKTIIATATPLPSETPSPSPRKSRSDIEIYIAFLGVNENSGACADIMRSKGFIPFFFIETDDLRQYPDMVRKLNGIGCGIGLLFKDDPEKEYAEFSELLRESVRAVTFLLASTSPLSSETVKKVQDSGLILWCAQEPEIDINQLIINLETAENRYDLILGSNVSVNRVTRLANYLRTESFAVKEITELTETAFSMQKKELGDKNDDRA